MIDFIILGAQKAATSSLQQCLRHVSGIYMPKGESPYFESPQYERQLWLDFPSKVLRQKCNGIKRPDILCSYELLARVKEHTPKAKFIVVLRPPIERAISAYYHLVRHGHIDNMPLNKGLKRCIKHYLLAKKDIYASVIESGLYGQYLSKWYENFVPSSFLILSDKALKNDIEAGVEACCQHLGVAYQYASNVQLSSANIGVYNPVLMAGCRLGHLIKTNKLPHKPRRYASPNRFRRVIGSFIARICEYAAVYVSNKPASLSVEVKMELERIYNDDAVLLANLVSPDIIYWRYAANITKGSGT